MKKSFFIFTLFFYLCICLFAEIKPTARLVVCFPDVEGINADESVYICSAVQDNLEANFSQYTFFQLVDLKNYQKVIGLQKKSVIDPLFDENTTIEVGKIGFAEYAIFSKIHKSGSAYSITSDFTNITTGEKSTVVSSKYFDIADLVNKPGCAVNEISVKLFDLLKLEISDYQKYELLKDIGTLSVQDQEKQAQENTKFYEKRIKQIENEINQIKKSSAENKNEEELRLEAIKALNEEKLLSNKRLLERIKEDSKRKSEDEKRDLLRSAEQRKQREDLIQKIDLEANKIREMRHNYNSPSQEIDQIEAKKKVLFEIRKSVEENLNQIKKEYSSEYKEKLSELKEKPYRSVELINGVPSEEAKKNRQKKEKDLLDDFNEKVREEEVYLKYAIKKQDNFLVSEIRRDYAQLNESKATSSMDSYVTPIFSSYNPEKKGWNVLLQVEDNYVFFVEQIWISYSDVEAVVPDSNNTDKYEAYLDKVEILDSCFQRGDPILLFLMNYSITPMPDNFPSQYQIKVNEITVQDFIKKTIIKKESDFSRVTKITRKPSYDLKDLQDLNVTKEVSDNKTYLSGKKNLKSKINKDFKLDFERNRNQYPNPILTNSLYIGLDENKSFIRNTVELFPIPFSFFRLKTLQVSFGKERSSSVESVGTGLEVWVPFTESFCLYGAGDWAIGEYKYNQGYYYSYGRNSFEFTSGLYTVGIRVGFGSEVKWVFNLGYGVQLATNIKDHYRMDNNSVINLGIGFGLDFF